MHEVQPHTSGNKRAFVGVMCLLLLTASAMTAAWNWPDQTLMHFWLVAQATPVLYVILAWWGAPSSISEDRDAR